MEQASKQWSLVFQQIWRSIELRNFSFVKHQYSIRIQYRIDSVGYS